MDDILPGEQGVIPQVDGKKFDTSHREDTPFQKELKKLDEEMDRLYREELLKVEPDSVRFGFNSIKDGGGSRL